MSKFLRVHQKLRIVILKYLKYLNPYENFVFVVLSPKKKKNSKLKILKRQKMVEKDWKEKMN